MARRQAAPVAGVLTPMGRKPTPPGGQPPRGRNATPEAAYLQRLGSAAAEDLRKTVRKGLTDLFGNFLRRFPGEVSKLARGLPDGEERRTLEGLALSVTRNTGKWMDGFIQHIDNQMIGGIAVAPEAKVGEDYVAVASVELRAEARYRPLISELDARLDRVRQRLYLPVHGKALAPAGLTRALQETADAMGWPAPYRRMLFDKFEELVIPVLQPLYQSLIAALTHISAAVDEAPAPDGAPVKAVLPPQDDNAAGAPPAPSNVTPIRPPAVPPKVDDNTIAMLQSHAPKAGDGSYNDGSLASDLLALTSNEPLPDMPKDQSWVPLQRMKLAGDFLNQAIADPFIPEELRPQHESMRFPLVKSALTDSTLFTAVTHPLRSLVNELMLKSATSRITGSAEARRMAELLQQVLVQFDLAPDFVRQAMLSAGPIPEGQIRQFFDSQRQQAQQRRDTVINEAKRLALREMELCTFGRGVPTPALMFLNTAWGPLLVKRLLQHGAEHESWKEGIGRMEQLLDQLDVREPGTPPTSEWTALMNAIAKDLSAAGLAGPRITEALSGLEAARQTAKE